MNTVQTNYQEIECDEQTALQHIAMAQMMDDDDKQANNEAKPEEYANQMQFSAIQEQTYGNQDNYYNFQICLLYTSDAADE